VQAVKQKRPEELVKFFRASVAHASNSGYSGGRGSGGSKFMGKEFAYLEKKKITKKG
jgi:hypothetical protein